MKTARAVAQPTPGSAADLSPDADPESVARAIVLRKLTAAPRTRAQLATDLRGRNVPDDVSERVLDRFTQVGLVDDSAFAESWVRNRATGKGLARSALRHELRQRGVADDIIDDALSSMGADQEHAAATELVVSRLPATRGMPIERRMRRLLGMLVRKGYPLGLASSVVRDALAGEESR